VVKAVMDAVVPKRFELKSLEGGWVELKQLNYHQVLQRREKATRFQLSGEQQRGTAVEISMPMVTEALTLEDFKLCIHDHNLEDEEGNKLDLSSAATLARIDPRVADEINQLINRLNIFEENALGNSGNGSGPAST
jgi:hypothetical protein